MEWKLPHINVEKVRGYKKVELPIPKYQQKTFLLKWHPWGEKLWT